MERIITSIDQHGRMLIPANVREKLNINPGEKVTLEIEAKQVKIISTDYVIDEMHALFTKNQTAKKESVVDDFIQQKRQEFLIEEARQEMQND